MRRGIGITAAAVLLALAAGCGDDDGGEAATAADAAVDETSTSADAEGEATGGDGDCTIGDCVDALMDELSSIPLPGSVDEIAEGFDAPDRYSQDVYFDAPVADLVSFYEAELPGAGFEIMSSEGADDFHTIEFEDPEGRSGSALIRTAATHESQVSYEVLKT